MTGDEAKPEPAYMHLTDFQGQTHLWVAVMYYEYRVGKVRKSLALMINSVYETSLN